MNTNIYNDYFDFLDGYVAAMRWVGIMSYDDDDTDKHADKPLAKTAQIAIFQDCHDFYMSNFELLESAGIDDYERHGHDFYLTRCGHGTGFWDRGYPDAIGTKLTEAAKSYGDATLYVGDDDNLLHYYNQ